MARLSPQELRTRLAFDFKVIRGLKSPVLGPVRGFATAEDARRGKDATDADGEAGRATIYVAEFRFPILIGPGPTTPRATCRIDLLAGGHYPFSAPAATIISRPLPWSPHVLPAVGSVCLGDSWAQARGRMLAAQLVVHVMHILNCDEPDRGPFYVGWNGDAIRYWRTTLDGKPLNPDIQYPALPADITHGIEDPSAAFTAAPAAAVAAAEVAFVPAAPAAFARVPDAGFVVAHEAGFAPVRVPRGDDEDVFMPIGGRR